MPPPNRLVTFVDAQGRKFSRLIPYYAPDSDAIIGIEIGPPDLGPLGLPSEVEIRLNNQLYNRGLITADDVHRRPGEVVAAVIAAFKADASRVMQLYDS